MTLYALLIYIQIIMFLLLSMTMTRYFQKRLPNKLNSVLAALEQFKSAILAVFSATGSD